MIHNVIITKASVIESEDKFMENIFGNDPKNFHLEDFEKRKNVLPILWLPELTFIPRPAGIFILLTDLEEEINNVFNHLKLLFS